MTRFLITLVLAAAMATFALAQPTASKSTAENDIFSGMVSAATPDKVTVVRKVPAKPDESRDFVVGKDTKVEGHLKVSARVSVRFKADADGVFHALRIIVRTDTKITGGPATPRPPATKK